MSQKLDLIISFLSNIKLALNYGSTFPIRFFSTIAIIDSQKIILVKIYSNIIMMHQCINFPGFYGQLQKRTIQCQKKISPLPLLKY